MRLSTFGKPRIISCGQDFAQHVALPRGCLADAKALLTDSLAILGNLPGAAFGNPDSIMAIAGGLADVGLDLGAQRGDRARRLA